MDLATVTLLAWMHIGGGEFEFVRQPDLTRQQCVLQALRIESERGAQAWCFSDPDEPTAPYDRHFGPRPMCASCGFLPGRRRI
jgi:hypothetical protein